MKPVSKAWKHFTKQSDKVASCNKCLKQIRYSGCTTNLHKHLKVHSILEAKHTVSKRMKKEEHKNSYPPSPASVTANSIESTSMMDTATDPISIKNSIFKGKRYKKQPILKVVTEPAWSEIREPITQAECESQNTDFESMSMSDLRRMALISQIKASQAEERAAIAQEQLAHYKISTLFPETDSESNMYNTDG